MNFYVDAGVAQSGNGTSWAGAWKSLAAIQWASVHPGDTIFVSGGTYQETLNVGASGASGAPVTITHSQEAGHDAPVVLDEQGTRAYGVSVDGRNWVTVDGLFVRNITDAGVRVRGATAGVIIQNNDVYSGDPGGGNARGYDVRNSVGANAVIVQLNKFSTPASTKAQTDGIWSSGNDGVVFQKNTIVISNSDTTGHSDGAQSYLDKNIVIDNNYISHPNGGVNNHGMWLSDTLTGGTITVSNNTVVNPKGDELGISHWNENSTWTGRAVITGNNVYGASKGIQVYDSPNSMVSGNTIQPTTGGVGVYVAGQAPPAGNISNNTVYTPGPTNNPPPPPDYSGTAPPATSPDNTVIVAGSSAVITDAAGVKWGITPDAKVSINGVADNTTSGVTTLAWEQGKVWQENTANKWWYNTGGSGQWGPQGGTTTSPIPGAAPTTEVSAHTISVVLSEDAYRGDARFVASLDGKQVQGSTAVTVDHGHAAQTFNIGAQYAPGPHDFAVSYVNDLTRSPTQDRNLYIQDVKVDGVSMLGHEVALKSNGAFHLTIGADGQ